MRTTKDLMKKTRLPHLAVMTTIIAGTLCASPVLAQTPARFYLDTLSGGNAVPLIYETISGNTNPFDPSHQVTAGANFEATMAMGGYAKALPLFDRSALAAIILPMGRISGEVTAGPTTVTEAANGYGDPMLEFNINLIGPPAQKTIPDLLRYQPGFSVDLLVDLALPIGEYDSSQVLNIGQNRWYGRVGAPVIWQLGDWVPGRRTTLEFLPAVWLFGDNDDYAGKTLETDPTYQLDAHLSRDFTDGVWGSFDFVWYSGGKATVDGVAGEALDNRGIGFTLGYTVNDNLSLTAGYKSTISDSDPGDLSMDAFVLTLVYGWHPIIEGAKRLKSE